MPSKKPYKPLQDKKSKSKQNLTPRTDSKNKTAQNSKSKSKQNLGAQTDSKKTLHVNEQTEPKVNKTAGNQTELKENIKKDNNNKNNKDNNKNNCCPQIFLIQQPQDGANFRYRSKPKLAKCDNQRTDYNNFDSSKCNNNKYNSQRCSSSVSNYAFNRTKSQNFNQCVSQSQRYQNAPGSFCGNSCGRQSKGTGTFGATPLNVSNGRNPQIIPISNECLPPDIQDLISKAIKGSTADCNDNKASKEAECNTVIDQTSKECSTENHRMPSWWYRAHRNRRGQNFGGPPPGCNGNTMGFPRMPYPAANIPLMGQPGRNPCPAPQKGLNNFSCQPVAPPTAQMMSMQQAMPPMPAGAMLGANNPLNLSMLLPLIAMRRLAWYREWNHSSNDAQNGNSGIDNDDEPKSRNDRGQKNRSSQQENYNDRDKEIMKEGKDTVCSRWRNMCNAKRDICADEHQRCKLGITTEECKKWQQECDDVRDVCGTEEKEQEGGKADKGTKPKSKSSSKGSLPSKKSSKKLKNK